MGSEPEPSRALLVAVLEALRREPPAPEWLPYNWADEIKKLPFHELPSLAPGVLDGYVSPTVATERQGQED